MDEISTASEEQAQGVEQVNRSMTQMEKPNNIDRIQALLYYLSNRFNT